MPLRRRATCDLLQRHSADAVARGHLNTRTPSSHSILAPQSHLNNRCKGNSSLETSLKFNVIASGEKRATASDEQILVLAVTSVLLHKSSHSDIVRVEKGEETRPAQVCG